ncbi:MAG: transcriptional regulator PtsJ [Halothiobacillaceae bacterium]
MGIQGRNAAEIFASIRQGVQSGEWLPGHVLPPVRELAEALAVNRNTVAAVYKRLVSAGIAATQGRLGTVICAATRQGELEGAAIESGLLDLASGNPAAAWLPNPWLALQTVAPKPRLYGEPEVNPRLEALARRWFADAGMSDYALNLSHGAVDGIERLLMAYLMPGDRVALEDPCFLGSLHTLRALNMKPVAVAVDAEGMVPDALLRALEQGVEALVYTPRAHNPTGCSLSVSRAEQLRAILADYPHVLLIEDDHFALLAAQDYVSMIPPTSFHWARLRSVSKGLGPDWRLALLASDAQTSQRLRMRMTSGVSWVSHLLQDAVSGLLESATVQAQLGMAREDYAHKRHTLVRELTAQGLPQAQAGDGLNVWIPLAVNANEMVHRLARRGWLVRSSAAFTLQSVQQAIRVTISTLDDAQSRRFVADFKAVLSD